MQSRRHLNLVIALPAEAKPLINHLQLKRFQPIGIFPLYVTSDVYLVVTGPGVASMQRGVAYLHEMTPPGTEPVWVNIGICGHGSLDIGELLWVEQVIEQKSGGGWRLNTHFENTMNHSPLSCVANPQAVYEPQMAYDMESSGFLTAVTGIAAADDIHLFKVVSDNPQCGIETINAKRVRELVTTKIGQLSDLIRWVTS